MTLEELIRFHTEEAEKMKLHKKVNEIILGTEAYERALQEHTQTAEWLKELKERRKQPEITQDQLEEYCKKRCLTVITDDLYYKLTSGSKDTNTWESCGEFYEHRSGLEKFKCNRCGGEVILYFGAKYPNFCPYCGRKSIADTGYERKIEDNGYGFMLITGRRLSED